MRVTSAAWDPSRPQGSDEDPDAWEETELFLLVTFRDLSSSPEWLALSHAVRIHFSHPPAVKFVFYDDRGYYWNVIMENFQHAQK